MDVEQLALLGIAVFSFMAIVSLYSAVRSYKRAFKQQPMRIRRLIGGKDSARAVARSIVRETAEKHEAEVRKSRETGRVTESLEDALAEARAYFLSRVEPIHRTLFSEAVNDIILNETNSGEAAIAREDDSRGDS